MIIVTPRKNGAKGWRAAWKQPGPDGSMRQMFRHIGDVSRAEAMMRCGEIQRELDAAPLITPKSIQAWSVQFFAVCGPIDRKTVYMYKQTFASLLAHFGTEKLLSDVTAADVRGFVTYLRSCRKSDDTAFSNSLINRRLRDSRHIWAVAIEADAVRTNPWASQAAKQMRQLHKVGTSEFLEVNQESLAKLVSACPDNRWQALFMLTRLSGLRIGEALRLDWCDIDMNAMTIRVQTLEEHGAKRDGTKRRERLVPVSAELYDFLANQPSRTGSLCQTLATDDRSLYRKVAPIIKRSGVGEYGKVFHSLRKNCLDDWMDTYPIQDVAEWAGNSVEVLMRHYRSKNRASRLAAAAGVSSFGTKRTPEAHKQVGANQQVPENKTCARSSIG